MAKKGSTNFHRGAKVEVFPKLVNGFQPFSLHKAPS